MTSAPYRTAAIWGTLCLACSARSGSTAVPVDAVFSIGINNNLTGPPQSAPVVNLRFSGGVPGPDTVVAVRMGARPVIDGSDGDWDGVVASEIPLVPPGAAVGMDQAAWDRE